MPRTIAAAWAEFAAAEYGRDDGDAGEGDGVGQGGEGEEDGWELAETELIENASHGDRHADPELDAFSPEREADRSTAVYGETDAIRSTETDED